MKIYSYGKKFYSVSDEDFKLLTDFDVHPSMFFNMNFKEGVLSAEEEKELLSKYTPITNTFFHIKSAACFIGGFLVSLLTAENGFLNGFAAYTAMCIATFFVYVIISVFILKSGSCEHPKTESEHEAAYKNYMFMKFGVPVIACILVFLVHACGGNLTLE